MTKVSTSQSPASEQASNEVEKKTSEEALSGNGAGWSDSEEEADVPSVANTQRAGETDSEVEVLDGDDVERGRVSPQVAKRMLRALMFPAVIMPVTGSMLRVALPVIRDDFQIPADTTAWISAAFMLPFMVLMPVYGRLSDVVGRRRMLLLGIFIFLIGTFMTVASRGLGMLVAGRAVQGFGASGLMPLGMAFIAAIFSTKTRGKAMGTWSQVGPIAGFVGPLIAGVIITYWGWRTSFAVPLLVGSIAFAVVYFVIPSGLSTIEPRFLLQFDWLGVFFLAGTCTGLLFYLSSRPITGYAPLTDWRLLLITFVFFILLIWWERKRLEPFIPLEVFRDRVFVSASGAASTRMVVMSGLGFLLPLYLVDIRGLSAAIVGVMLVINPGAMSLMVRQGGKLADKLGSKIPVLTGLLIQGTTLFIFFLLPETVSIWIVVAVLAFNGFGAGLMLAPLHRSAMGNTEPERMGSVAGMYNLVRFAGMACGTALAGVILQFFLDTGATVLDAYQLTFLCFLLAPVVGIIIANTMKEPAMEPQKAKS